MAITALFPISHHCINNKFGHVNDLGDLARIRYDQESQDSHPNVVDEVRLNGCFAAISAAFANKDLWLEMTALCSLAQAPIRLV